MPHRPHTADRLAATLALALCATMATTASPAAARLYAHDPPRVELGLETAFAAIDTDGSFDPIKPRVLFGVGGGVYVTPDLRIGAVVRAAITDPHAAHYEALADLTWSWVDEPRLPDPPALRLAASLELGWRSTELRGEDVVVDDSGFVLELGFEVGLVAFEDVSLSLRLAAVSGTATNPEVDAWAPKVRLGVVLQTVF